MTHPYEIQAMPPCKPFSWRQENGLLHIMASSRAHALLSVRELFPGWQVLAVRREGEW